MDGRSVTVVGVCSLATATSKEFTFRIVYEAYSEQLRVKAGAALQMVASGSSIGLVTFRLRLES